MGIVGSEGMHMRRSWWWGEVAGGAYVPLNCVPRDAAAASACVIACLNAGISAKVSPLSLKLTSLLNRSSVSRKTCFFWGVYMRIVVNTRIDVRPREHRAAVAVHGVGEGVLPDETLVVRVDHREIAVKAVDRVSDESARFHTDDLSVGCVKYDQAV